MSALEEDQNATEEPKKEETKEEESPEKTENEQRKSLVGLSP